MRALKAARTQARVACPAPRGSHREGRPTSPRHGTVRGYCIPKYAGGPACMAWRLRMRSCAARHDCPCIIGDGISFAPSLPAADHAGGPAAWAWAVALELWMGREQSSALRRRLGCMSAQLSPAAGGGGPLTALEGTARAEDDGTYGEQEGFPAWGSLADLHLDHIAMSNETRGCPVVAKHRVGNFVNVPGQGFESVFPHNTIRADPTTSAPLAAALKPDFSYEYNGQRRTPADYLDTWPVTGLFIGRGDEIWLEEYRYARDGDMRFTSWSMAKSVTSLLLGVAVDRGLISSLDDTPDMYVPELKGVDVVHGRDNPTIYPRAHWGPGSDITATVAGWNTGPREPQGSLFNYTELCPLTVGVTLRAVTGITLSEFAEEALWGPMGAEADATWCVDSHGNEFNCVNFACRLRDWARLGHVIANRGVGLSGKRVVSEAWIDEISSWGPLDSQVTLGQSEGDALEELSELADVGYKCFMWHLRSDGSLLMFNGAYGQRVIVHLPTKTVLVQTAVTDVADWLPELTAMIEAAAAI